MVFWNSLFIKSVCLKVSVDNKFIFALAQPQANNLKNVLGKVLMTAQIFIF